MVNKTLLYKYEYKNVEENTIPKFKPEDIGHILYTIEKGISSQRDYGNYTLFEEIPLEIKKFPVNFKSIINSTRLDITFLYKTTIIERDLDSDKIKGYFINDDVERVDITSFFTKIKNSISEHKIYQIGGRYSKSVEDIRGFRDDIRDKSLEEKRALLEGITKSGEFKSFHPKKQEFYLNILREIYHKLGPEKKYWKIQRKIEDAVSKQIKTRRFFNKELNIDVNPFKVDLKKFEFLKESKAEVSKTKSLLHKREYTKGTTIHDFDIEEIGSILFMLEFIPRHLDYEEATHNVNFRNVDEKTRKDIIYHYADKVPIIENGEFKDFKYLDRITKVDIVSFFTKEKDGRVEFRIYQIGRRYGSEAFSIDDLFGLGELNYDIENYDKAIEYYTKVLELEPEDTDTMNNLGLALVCKSNYKEAISLYQKALEIDSEDSITWDNLGLAYEYNNEYEKAKEAYQKALDLDSSDVEVKQHLIDINEKLRREIT